MAHEEINREELINFSSGNEEEEAPNGHETEPIDEIANLLNETIHRNKNETESLEKLAELSDKLSPQEKQTVTRLAAEYLDDEIFRKNGEENLLLLLNDIEQATSTPLEDLPNFYPNPEYTYSSDPTSAQKFERRAKTVRALGAILHSNAQNDDTANDETREEIALAISETVLQNFSRFQRRKAEKWLESPYAYFNTETEAEDAATRVTDKVDALEESLSNWAYE